MLLLRVLFVSSFFAEAAHAPGKAPDLPDGWCDPAFGTPTRTTGECMCRYRCEGRGCQAAQGFIWYAYAECPGCKCVAAGEKTDRSVSVEEEEVVEYDDDGNELPMYFEQEEEPELTVFEKAFEFIDDHGHEVLGGLFVLVLAAVCIPLIILGTLHGPVATAGAKEKDDKANEKATDKKKD